MPSESPIFRVVRPPHIIDYATREEFIVAHRELVKAEVTGSSWKPLFEGLPLVTGLDHPEYGGRHRATGREIVVYRDLSSILCERCGSPITEEEGRAHPYDGGLGKADPTSGWHSEVIPMWRHADVIDCRSYFRPDYRHLSWELESGLSDTSPQEYPTHREAHERAFRWAWNSTVPFEQQGAGAGEAEETYVHAYAEMHDRLCRCRLDKGEKEPTYHYAERPCLGGENPECCGREGAPHHCQLIATDTDAAVAEARQLSPTYITRFSCGAVSAYVLCADLLGWGRIFDTPDGTAGGKMVWGGNILRGGGKVRRDAMLRYTPAREYGEVLDERLAAEKTTVDALVDGLLSGEASHV